MASQVVELRCPGCNARISVDQKICDSCFEPVVISTFNKVYGMERTKVNKYVNVYKKMSEENSENTGVNAAIAMCYLKLGQYSAALNAFEKAVEDDFDNSETFFYCAVCRLDKKTPFRQKRDTIEQILRDLESAIMLEPRGIYYYFKAYVIYDYYCKKKLKMSENYMDVLQDAKDCGIAQGDIEMLRSLEGIEIPPALSI